MSSTTSRSGWGRRAFLCHSSLDKPAVRKLYARLRKDGVEPWFDEADLLPGQDWESEIRRAIRQCQVVIVCLSITSVDKVGFLQKEIRLALDWAEHQPEGTISVIPARLEPCEIPERLAGWQWVDLFDRRGYARLMRALEFCLGPLKSSPPVVSLPTEPSAFGPETVQLTRPNGVPRYATSFIDRLEEIEHFKWAMRPDALITITGPPGCGKTRMAAELSGQLEMEGTTVTWLDVREGDDVANLTARLAAEAVGAAIVVNDADLALQASADLIRRLRVGPDIAVVATSRLRLGVYGEQLLPLVGLPVPEQHLRPGRIRVELKPDLERLQLQESMSLFVHRAMLASPGFRLDQTNAAAVFDLCRWLDGLPLAIELAALRLQQMTVTDLAHGLGDLLPLLDGNTPDTPRRHVSLEAAVAWSFAQLTDEQRVVATRLCSFSTPFRLEDAVEVAADEDVTARRVNETVRELVHGSLLVRNVDSDHRSVYKWPNAIRAYGLRELDHGADARIRERYTNWLLRFMESLKNDRAWSETEWAKLAALSPDVFAAVHRLPAEEQHAAVSRLEDASVNLLMFGHREGLDLVERLAARSTDSWPAVFRQAGIAARVKGKWAEADEYLATAYQAAVHQRDLLGQANILRDLAENAADQENYERATEQATRARSLYEELDDAIGGLEVKNLLGKLLLETGELARGEELLEEARQGASEMEARRLEAYSLHNLGICDLAVRRVASARARLGQSLEIRRTMGNLRGVARLLESFAIVESVMENHLVALRLLGAATQIRSSRDVHGIPLGLQRRLDRVEADAEVALVGTRWDVERLLGLGAALSIEDAAELALGDTDAVFRVPLETPVSEPLRRRAPAGSRVAGEPGVPVDDTALDQVLDQLAAGSGSATEILRRLQSRELLVLGEPIGARFDDVFCFGIPPDRHRGIVLPAFSSRRALTEVLHSRPDWAAKPVMTVRFDRIRSALIAGETVVVNPWLATEYRFSRSEAFGGGQ